MNQEITHLFLDLGGVVLTNGWDHHSRQQAYQRFNLDPSETEQRHRLIFDAYEVGKFTLDEYLNLVVFYKTRAFTKNEFQQFMFDQSNAFPEMIALIQEVKKQRNLKIFVVSNEGRELTDYRIKKFQLNSWVDVFISSCYVHLKKPDKRIYQLALDVSQASPKQVLYIENTPLYVEIAEGMGIPSLLYKDYASTYNRLFG